MLRGVVAWSCGQDAICGIPRFVIHLKGPGATPVARYKVVSALRSSDLVLVATAGHCYRASICLIARFYSVPLHFSLPLTPAQRLWETGSPTVCLQLRLKSLPQRKVSSIASDLPDPRKDST